MAENASTAAQDGDEEHIDGCSCGTELQQGEMTADTELPVASGGVIAAPQEQAPEDEDEIDGCDAVFGSTEVTADEELPPATGGVA